MSNALQIVKPINITSAMLISSTVPETDHAEYSAGTTYTKGARVLVTASHLVYESLQAGNTGHAVTDPAWWVEVGATNRWLMFDQKIGSRTTNTNSIVVVIKPGKIVNSVCLVDVVAASVRIQVSDPVIGAVYDKTMSMVSSDGIVDWYAYFFSPVEYKQQVMRFDLPPIADPSVRITIANTGDNAECGACVLGTAVEIAPVLMGASVGIVDYSRKERDDWGNYSITERAFSKRSSFRLIVPRNRLDGVYKLMAELRATPCVYVATDTIEATTIYGFAKEFDMNIAYPNHFDMTLELESLV